jgi:hypothetical protein
MFIVYIILFIVVLIISIYAGIKLSEGINHTTLLVFFWIIYIATLLTIGNAVSTVFFYNVLRTKRGIPGEPGRVGDKGESGVAGVCDISCDSKVCTLNITNGLNKYYGELTSSYFKRDSNLDIDKKPTIKNSEVFGNIKIICGSDAYKQVIKFKSPQIINNYILNIYSKWLKLLFDSDKSTDKQLIRDYLETAGLQEQPTLEGDPFKEIEKYDIYYWGRDRVFHPRVIEYCNNPDINKKMHQVSHPILKGIRTNLYNQVIEGYSFRRNRIRGPAGRRTKKVSVYRVNPYNYQGTIYYSLGDYIREPPKNFPNTNKFIELYGVKNKNRIEYKNNALFNSPNEPTILVSSSDKYVKPPQDWELIWTNKKKLNNKNISFWKPKDYFDKSQNKLFKGCGVFTLQFPGGWKQSNLYINPRQYYGYNTPERQPIRLVAQELLEEIKFNNNNVSEIWNDRKSGTPESLSFWRLINSKYNLTNNRAFGIRSYKKPVGQSFYNIKDAAFSNMSTKSVNFKHELTDERNLGTGYLGSPERNEKYSIFSFLNIPLDIQLTNVGNSNKIYIKHSGLNTINSYMIRNTDANDSNLLASFGISRNKKDNRVGIKNKYNTADPNQIWQVECVDLTNKKSSSCDKKRYFIRSNESKLYLTCELDKSTTGSFEYYVRPLPNITDKEYNTIITKYVWYNPLSATGNQLNANKK